MHWVDLGGRTCEHIAVDSRALMYADGFFTTIRVNHSVCQLLKYHFERILRSAQVLGLEVSKSTHSLLNHRLHALAQELGDGIIKVHVSRQSGTRGYAGSSTEAIFLLGTSITAGSDKLPLQPSTVAPILSARLSLKPNNLAGLKTLDKLEQVLLANELDLYRSAGGDIGEGLVCTLDGLVCEGVSSNVFFFIDSTWMTPKLDRAGVAGTLRAALLEHLPIQESTLSQVQLLKRDIEAVFFASALRGVMPVRQILEPATATVKHLPTSAQVVAQLHRQLCSHRHFMRALG